MKKWFATAMAAVLCLVSMAAAAEKKDPNAGLPELDGFRYRLLEDGTAEIVEYTGREFSLTIPEKIDGYTVTSIGDEALYCYRYSFGDALIPETVTHIGASAFAMADVESIRIPASVLTMGDNPFGYAEELTEITVAEDNPAFYTKDGVLFSRADSGLVCYPAGLENDTYTVPDGTEAIYGSAFGGCEALRTVELPDTLKTIGEQAFAFCWSLESIAIPDSVTEIGDGAFDTCKALQTAKLPEGLTRIGDMMFYECGDLETAPIPETVTEIGESAFAYCALLDEIRIPEGLTEIADGAFEGCENITSAVIPNGVTRIGGWAFGGCFRLSEVRIPDSVTEIGEQAFQYCSQLRELAIPDSVVKIGDDAFFNHADDLVVTAGENSYALKWCGENGIPTAVRSE